MFRPIHSHHQVDLTLKILLCSRILRVTINLMMAMNWPKHVVAF